MRWLFKYRRVLTLVALSLLTAWQTSQSPHRWNKFCGYMHLIRMDWERERRRLLRFWAYSLLAVCFTVALLLVASVLAIALSWNTPYFTGTCIAILGGYSLAVLICVYKAVTLAKLGSHAFATSRYEIKQAFAALRDGPEKSQSQSLKP
jgi:hypothetical protein